MRFSVRLCAFCPWQLGKTANNPPRRRRKGMGGRQCCRIKVLGRREGESMLPQLYLSCQVIWSWTKQWTCLLSSVFLKDFQGGQRIWQILFYFTVLKEPKNKGKIIGSYGSMLKTSGRVLQRDKDKWNLQRKERWALSAVWYFRQDVSSLSRCSRTTL